MDVSICDILFKLPLPYLKRFLTLYVAADLLLALLLARVDNMMSNTKLKTFSTSKTLKHHYALYFQYLLESHVELPFSAGLLCIIPRAVPRHEAFKLKTF